MLCEKPSSLRKADLVADLDVELLGREGLVLLRHRVFLRRERRTARQRGEGDDELESLHAVLLKSRMPRLQRLWLCALTERTNATTSPICSSVSSSAHGGMPGERPSDSPPLAHDQTDVGVVLVAAAQVGRTWRVQASGAAVAVGVDAVAGDAVVRVHQAAAEHRGVLAVARQQRAGRVGRVDLFGLGPHGGGTEAEHGGGQRRRAPQARAGRKVQFMAAPSSLRQRRHAGRALRTGQRLMNATRSSLSCWFSSSWRTSGDTLLRSSPPRA